MDNYNYPEGADISSAPWNQEDDVDRKVNVLVSITMSKSFSIDLNDYPEIDLDLNPDLKDVVMDQIILPFEAYQYLPCNLPSKVESDLKGYNVDDLEVVLEDEYC